MGNQHSKDMLFDDDPRLTHRDFQELYSVGDEIGHGSFAHVYKCFRKSDRSQFAVKVIQCKYLSSKELDGLRTEINILKRLTQNKHIIKLNGVFYDHETLFMVLELCNGKDLFDKIVETKETKLSECQCAEIVYQLSEAVQYLHENGVVHRDLKPENVLFGVDGFLKVTDFGLAHDSGASLSSLDSHESIVMKTCCGTPHYVCPEIVCEGDTFYSDACDMWSIGVILYVTLVGYQPFHGNSLPETYRRITHARYDFKSKRWDTVSKEAKDLVQCLLQMDPQKRYTPKDVQSHSFILKHMGHIK